MSSDLAPPASTEDAVFLDAGGAMKPGPLSTAVAHYVAVVCTNAQRRLADGEYADEVVAHLVETLNDWLQARGVPYYTPLGTTVRFIDGLEQTVRGLIGAEATSAWFTCPNPALEGRSPVDALVRHRFDSVQVAVELLRRRQTPAERKAENDDLAEREQEAAEARDRIHRRHHAADEAPEADESVGTEDEAQELRAAARELGIDPDDVAGQESPEADDEPGTSR